MKAKYVIGMIVIILGGLIALGPQTVFPVCESSKLINASVEQSSTMKMEGMESMGGTEAGSGAKKMRCYHTGVASLATGIGLMLLGVTLFAFKNKKLQLVIKGFIGLLGVLTALYPTVLIGTCKPVHASCHSLTSPILVILGIVTVIVVVIALFLERKNEQ